MFQEAPRRTSRFVRRIGWLRAAVLGANDGILSTASLIVGVATSSASAGSILVAGAAGLVAGSMSMAAGEYVSVSSQSDVEKAELEREALELRDDPVAEHQELAQIYVGRGLSVELASQVATQLMSSNALAAHARDELGLSDVTAARPIQAALASALSFAIGAALPLLMVVIAPADALVPAVFISSLAFLALLGALGACTGGANPTKGAARVAFWGAGAMASTAGIGAIFGSSTY
ncbi:MAG: VIT family protein [Mesorhizobium sp.]|nr:VIT family protein [Mesorhizobium sp.]MBL8577235.1 VIT family protein [Mesorhizobium sp.]